MALLPRLRRLMRRPASSSKGGVGRPPASRRHETIHEESLRDHLHENPNDPQAFQALVEIVRRRAAEMGPDGDPLTAPQDDVEKQRRADLAVWSLGEELAGNPRAWYPLIELGRLSVHDDHEGTIRRLTTAAERDPSGQALAEALQVLRDGGLPVEALGLGVGHWKVKEHTPEIGRQLVLAAIEADRPLEAKHHLHAMEMHPDHHAVARMRADLEHAVAQAEQGIPGT